MAQYIVPTLKIISFNCDRGEVSGFDLSDNLITAIADRCPLLEELSIKIISTWHNPATMSSMAFASALRKLHSLLKVELQVGIVGTISLAVLLALSEHPSLNVLKLPDMRLDYTPRTDPVNQLVHTNLRGGNIFRNLEVLQVSVSNAALSVILPYVGKLRRLELVPYPSGENLLESFDGILLPNLEEAIFDSWSDNPIPARSFDVFAKSVPNLQVLEFPTKRKGRNVHYPVANLNDAQIQRMIQNLKKIRNFSLAVQAPLLTEASIAFLGQNCQQLEHFQLMGNFAFEEVIRRSTNNCWLKLTSFDIGSIDNHRNSRVANIRRPITVARGLLRIMPKLNAAPFPAGIPIQRALRERALLAGREWN